MEGQKLGIENTVKEPELLSEEEERNIKDGFRVVMTYLHGDEEAEAEYQNAVRGYGEQYRDFTEVRTTNKLNKDKKWEVKLWAK